MVGFTEPTTRARRRAAAALMGCTAGFTLFEVLLGLMLMALIAALALPGPSRSVGPTALRTAAYQVSALLMNVRTAAVNEGRPASAVVDVGGHRVEGSGRWLDLPPGITVALADGRAPLIRFAADGTSTGGAVLLATATNRMTVAVNPATGAVRLAP